MAVSPPVQYCIMMETDFPHVVTEERTVPLQQMQVVIDDYNGNPVPGVIDGPPCPGGYKYGGMAL
jgi:hypothetical protein